MNNYKLVTVYKRGNILEGKIFVNSRGGANPYFAEVNYKGDIRTSPRFYDEDLASEWIETKFNEVEIKNKGD